MQVYRSNFVRPSRRGFTLVELVLGMLTTLLVAGAVAALLGAASAGWKAQQVSQAIAVSRQQVAASIREVVRGAAGIGYVVTGSVDGSDAQGAEVMIWRSDANADGLIQFSETALIVHDPASGVITLLEPDSDAADFDIAPTLLLDADLGPTVRAPGVTTSRTLCANVAGLRLAVRRGGTQTRSLLEIAGTYRHTTPAGTELQNFLDVVMVRPTGGGG